MARSPNAQHAAVMYAQLLQTFGWSKDDGWKGIAKLLLSCKVFVPQQGWVPFHDVVVYREANDFKVSAQGAPNSYLRKAELLSQYLAAELGVGRPLLCNDIGQYWNTPSIATTQPHNLVGHAFRSIGVEFLKRYGDPGVTYEEEVSPHSLFQGQTFTTRSKRSKLDIVAYRNGKFVAIISSRWRFRHDRVDVVDEAIAYAPVARRVNPNTEVYAMVGEFAISRLLKIIENCPPIHPHPALSACVHFEPNLILKGLGENGALKHMKSLSWLADQTWHWK